MDRYSFLSGLITFVLYVFLSGSEWGKKFEPFYRGIFSVLVGVTLAQIARGYFS